jgi:hypothetical protein
MLAGQFIGCRDLRLVEVPEPQLPDSSIVARSDGVSTRDDLFVWFGSAVLRQ